MDRLALRGIFDYQNTLSQYNNALNLSPNAGAISLKPPQDNLPSHRLAIPVRPQGGQLSVLYFRRSLKYICATAMIKNSITLARQ